MAAGAGALVAIFALGACGSTYVDSSVSVPPTGAAATTTTLPPVDPESPIELLLIEIEALMFDLDERIIDGDQPIETLARIDEIWTVAEQQIRDTDPDDVFNFEQAIELARSGVERTRPADASKGSKILTDVIDAYLSR